ncbi:MAG: hypothetical protein ACSHYF_08270 [Verrucomicrobiaceae bacterium]
MKFPFLLSILCLASALAGPLTLKDTKGREIVVLVTDYDKDTVTFEKGTKQYTVPWATFDEASIKLIKSTKLPGADNKRQEREETIILPEIGEKKIIVPAGKPLSKDGTLDLYPGDTIHLEFALEDGKLTKPEVVAEIANPERTITFAFTQNADFATLTRTTGIQKTVGIDCYELAHGSEEFSRSTHVVPTEKGKRDVYSWPSNIWRLQIKNIEVSDKPADEVFAERATR